MSGGWLRYLGPPPTHVQALTPQAKRAMLPAVVSSARAKGL